MKNLLWLMMNIIILEIFHFLILCTLYNNFFLLNTDPAECKANFQVEKADIPYMYLLNDLKNAAKICLLQWDSLQCHRRPTVFVLCKSLICARAAQSTRKHHR